MNKTMNSILLGLLFTAGSSFAQTLTVNLTEGCSNSAVSNGTWIKFVEDQPVAAGTVVPMQCLNGTASYTPGTTDGSFCGHLETMNGAVLGTVSGSNYWCADQDVAIDISLSFPVAAKYDLNGYSQSSPSVAPVVSQCGASRILKMYPSVTGTATGYELLVTKGTFGRSFKATDVTVSSGSIGAPVPQAIDMVQLFPDLENYNGAIEVSLVVGACTGKSAISKQYFILNTNEAIGDLSFTLGGVDNEALPMAVPSVHPCDGIIFHPGWSGSVSSYTLMAEEGFLQGNSFVPTGGSWSTTIKRLPEDVNLFDLFDEQFLIGYSGHIRVSFSATDYCSATASASGIYDLAPTTSLSALNFDLNGATQASPSATPPVVWLCDPADPLMFSGSVTGTLGNYTIQIEKGMWSGSVFSPSPSPITYTIWGSAIAPVDLRTLPGMAGYNGYVRVSITAFGPCSSGINNTQIFDVESGRVAVAFEMASNGCSGVTGTPAQTTLPIANASFTESPCATGWQGAVTAGISNFTYPDGVLSYHIAVDEVDPVSGAFIANIFDLPGSGPLPNWNFNTDCPGYAGNFFVNNYSALSTTNRTFKVTVTCTTAACTTSAYSYFRIAAGSENW